MILVCFGMVVKVAPPRFLTELGYVDVSVIYGIDVEVPPGNLVGIIGPNGAGKSTLVAAVLGSAGLGLASWWLVQQWGLHHLYELVPAFALASVLFYALFVAGLYRLTAWLFDGRAAVLAGLYAAFPPVFLNRYSLSNDGTPVDWGLSIYGDGEYFGKDDHLPGGYSSRFGLGVTEHLLIDIPVAGRYCIAVWKANQAQVALDGAYRLDDQAPAIPGPRAEEPAPREQVVGEETEVDRVPPRGVIGAHDNRPIKARRGRVGADAHRVEVLGHVPPGIPREPSPHHWRDGGQFRVHGVDPRLWKRPRRRQDAKTQ